MQLKFVATSNAPMFFPINGTKRNRSLRQTSVQNRMAAVPCRGRRTVPTPAITPRRGDGLQANMTTILRAPGLYGSLYAPSVDSVSEAVAEPEERPGGRVHVCVRTCTPTHVRQAVFCRKLKSTGRWSRRRPSRRWRQGVRQLSAYLLLLPEEQGEGGRCENLCRTAGDRVEGTNTGAGV